MLRLTLAHALLLVFENTFSNSEASFAYKNKITGFSVQQCTIDFTMNWSEKQKEGSRPYCDFITPLNIYIWGMFQFTELETTLPDPATNINTGGSRLQKTF